MKYIFVQLMKYGGMEVIDCNNHVKSTIKFFGPSCAVNSLIDKYNPLGTFNVRIYKVHISPCYNYYNLGCQLQVIILTSCVAYVLEKYLVASVQTKTLTQVTRGLFAAWLKRVKLPFWCIQLCKK